MTSEELGLTNQEVSAVKLYTSYSYKLINQYARGSLDSAEGKTLKKILKENKFLKTGFIGKESLETGVAKFNTTLETSRQKHPSNENFGNVVFRGMGFDYPGGAQDETQYTTIGSVIEQKSYTSTTVGRPFLNTHLLILQAHDAANGHWIAPSASFPGEDEVLFAPKTKFVIKDVVASDEFDGARFLGYYFFGKFHISQKIVKTPEYQQLSRPYEYIKKYIYGKIIP